MRKISGSVPEPALRSGKPALDAVVQRARAREVRQQILHLIREHPPALEEDVFRVGRRERNRDELHLRLLRRTRSLLIVAAPASGHDVGPDVDAALTEGPDVIARELA